MKTANIRKLLEEEKVLLMPTSQESAVVRKAASEFVGRLDKALKQAKVKAKAVVGGSGAKGTWLKGMHDIDVFVCFDYGKYNEKSGELSDFLAAAMKKVSKNYERMHGSRDYFRVPGKEYYFEVVPILKITRAREAKNITDASLLHSAWVKKQVAKYPGLDDEIRLTKAFAKAQGVYGAESYVKGFSGYACEVLTSHYGSFLGLMAASQKWKKQIAAGKKIIVDAAGYYKRRDPLRELNEAKVQSELIVIDPIQENRNATAALGNETLQRLILASELFLEKPGRNFFEKEEVTIEKLLETSKGKQLVAVEAKLPKGKEDVVGAKFLKAFEYVREYVGKNGFSLVNSGWDWDNRAASAAWNPSPRSAERNWDKKENALMWLIAEKKEPAPEIRDGPPLTNEVHAQKFREEHSGKTGRELFERDGRLYVKIEREHKQLRQLVIALIKKDNYLKDKALSYKVV